jgi:HPt (histidine-containing phosphotransfer) domain-containing protein
MDTLRQSSAEELPEGSVLDLALLDEAADFGIDDLRQLIDAFLAQADEIMILLRSAIDAGDAQTTEHLAHKLAGSSGVCGAVAVMQSLRALEQSTRKGCLSEADPLLQSVAEQLESSRRLLDEYLDSYSKRD